MSIQYQYLKRDDQVDLNFTCPAGGQWYACASGSHFVGCCTSDPCSNGCAQGNIRTVGFPAEQYGKFPDASCGSASNFFSCASGDKTFWGCCKSNPCANSQTCADGDLVPAFMERPEQFNVYAPDSEKAPDTHKEKKSNGPIIGGVVGGVLVLVIIIAVLVFFLCKKRRSKSKNNAEAATVPPQMRETQHSDIDAPPMYSSPNPNAYASPVDHKRTGSTEKTYFRHSTTNTQNFISELPGDNLSPTGGSSRFSELPAETTVGNTNRYSELPAAAPQHAAELETPVTSPRLG